MAVQADEESVTGVTKDIYSQNQATKIMPFSAESISISRRRRRQARLREQARDVARERYDYPGRSVVENGGMNEVDKSSQLLYGGSIFEGVTKRSEANARERLRVRNLNSGFAKLRRILPTIPPNRKPSKVDTLQGAIDYIHQLEQLLEATGGIPDVGCLAASTHSHSRQSVTECPFLPDIEGRSEDLSLTKTYSAAQRFNSASAVLFPIPPSINMRNDKVFATTVEQVPERMNAYASNYRDESIRWDGSSIRGRVSSPAGYDVTYSTYPVYYHPEAWRRQHSQSAGEEQFTQPNALYDTDQDSNESNSCENTRHVKPPQWKLPEDPGWYENIQERTNQFTLQV